jgi:hypothetical protein
MQYEYKEQQQQPTEQRRRRALTMNRRLLNTTNMLGGTHRFCLDHPLTPPSATATALITEIGTAYTTMLALGSAQSGGTAEWQNGTDQRSLAAQALRDKLRELVETARQLDNELYPGAGAIRMPRSGSMQALRDRSQAVLDAVGPIKAAFVEMDWAADFDEEFAGRIAAYDTATLDQSEGRYDQIAGTAGMPPAAQAGVKAVRKLNPLMRRRLKSDPGLLAAWMAASHIQKDAVRSGEEEGGSGAGGADPGAGGSGGESGGGSAPA